MKNSEEKNQTKSFFTLEEVETIKSESNDKYLRLAAEYENFKKRVQKEKEEIRFYTKNQMLSSILDLDSDLSIAVRQEPNNSGLVLMKNKITKFLSQQGIEDIQTDTYDVDTHEVVSVLEVGEEKVIDVVSKGYTQNGTPIRFPKIILGK